MFKKFLTGIILIVILCGLFSLTGGFSEKKIIENFSQEYVYNKNLCYFVVQDVNKEGDSYVLNFWVNGAHKDSTSWDNNIEHSIAHDFRTALYQQKGIITNIEVVVPTLQEVLEANSY